MSLQSAVDYLLLLKGKQIQYYVFQVIGRPKLNQLIQYIDTIVDPEPRITLLKEELTILLYLQVPN